jgi:UDP-glucose 4-epimerase
LYHYYILFPIGRGAHIVDQLITQGHQVIIIDNLVTGQQDLINPAAIFYQEDITNAQKVEEIVQKHQIQIICHQAAQLDVRKSVQDPQYDANVNIIGTINLFEAARKHGVTKVVFASSAGTVYGDKETLPVNESADTKPECPYGISKLTMEKYAYFYHKQYGISYVALRYSNVYGPRQNSHGEAGVVGIFTNKMLAGEDCFINGDGLITRDFIYIDDVVKACIIAINNEIIGEYNISRGEQTDINTIAKLLKEFSQYSKDIQYREKKPGEQLFGEYSSKLFQQKTNWKPIVGIQQGLLQTVEYFKNK